MKGFAEALIKFGNWAFEDNDPIMGKVLKKSKKRVLQQKILSSHNSPKLREKK